VILIDFIVLLINNNNNNKTDPLISYGSI